MIEWGPCLGIRPIGTTGLQWPYNPYIAIYFLACSIFPQFPLYALYFQNSISLIDRILRKLLKPQVSHCWPPNPVGFRLPHF